MLFPLQKRQVYQLFILFVFLCRGKPTYHCLHLHFTKLAKLGSFLPSSLYDKATMVSVTSPVSR